MIRKSNESVVDSRVVELTLDNSTFEKNATESISTISKLKKALDFQDAGKGLDEIEKLSKRIDMDTLSNGINIVIDRFSALDAVAFSVLNNITTKAVNATEAFVKSVSVDQVGAGWNKYAEKTSAVQTIMAATADQFKNQGEQMEYVNAQLDKLNWFTDETSYSFLDMVNNIGKFTSNSIELETAVTAMEGISTWAAMSGANVQEAGRAMYNLSQAIGVGSVKLQDWKSIENANMATAKFKQTVIETAESMGVLTKVQEGLWKTQAGHEVTLESFNEELKDGWFNKDVLLGSLKAYGGFTDELYKFIEGLGSGISTASEALGYIDKYAEGTLNVKQLADELGVSADELQTAFDGLSSDALDLGRSAFKAAQEAKTFQEAVDSVKDAVSTGWMNTFEILFGNYLDAKKLWTDLANTLYDVFAEGGNARNEILTEAMSQSEAINSEFWEEMSFRGFDTRAFRRTILAVAKDHGVAFAQMKSDEENFYELLDTGRIQSGWITEAWDILTGKITDSTEEANKNLEEIREKAIQVIRGDYTNNMDKRFELLAKEGFDPQRVQDYVNALKKATGGTWNLTEAAYKEADAQDVAVHGIEEASEARLKELGLTEAEIEDFKELAKHYEEAGKIGHLVFSNGEVSFTAATGAELWTQSLYNLMDALLGFSSVVNDAFDSVFAIDAGNVYSLISSFYKFTESLRLTDSETGDLNENGEKLRVTITGLFSALDIVLDVLTAIGKGASLLVNGLFDTLGFSVLDLTAWIGDLVIKLDNFLEKTDLFSKITWVISDGFKFIVGSVKDFVTGLGNIPIVSKNIDRFGKAFNKTFKRLPKFVDNLGKRFDAFKERTEALGGLNLDNAQVVFKDFRDNVLGYFGTAKAFKPLKKAFKDFFGDSTELFSGIGDYLKPIFDGVWNVVIAELPNVWGVITSALSNGWTMLTGAFSGLYTAISGAIGYVWDTLTATIEEKWPEIQESLTDWFASLPEKFRGLKDTVFGFFSSVWSNITTALSAVWTDISGAIAAAWPVVKEGFDGLWTSIKDWFASNTGVDLSFLETIIDAIVTGVRGLATVLGGALLTAFVVIVGIVRTVIDVFKEAWTAIGDFFKRFTKSGSGGGGGGGGSPTAAISSFDKFKNKFVSIIDKIKKVIAIGNRVFELFFNKLASFDNISFDAIVESFNFAKEALFDYLSHKFPGFARFRYEFDAVVKKIKEGLANMGLDSEGIKSKWNKFSTFAGNAFERIYKGAKDLGSNVVKTVSDFLANPIVKKNIDNFKGAFGDAWGNLGDFFSGLWDTVINWWNGIAEGGTLDFKNIGDWIVSLKDAIKSYFGDFHGFDSIKNAFSQAWDDIITVLDEKGVLDKLNKFKEDIDKALKDFSLGDVFNAFLKLFTESNEDMEDSEEKTITTADNIRKVVEDFVSGMTDLLSHFDMGDEFQDFIGLFTTTVDEVDKAAEDTDDTGNFFVKVISTFISDLNTALKDFPTETLEGVVKTIAELFTALGFYNAGKGINRFSKVLKGESRGDLLKGLTGLIWAITGLVGSIALATAVLDPDEFQSNLEAVKACIEAISVFVSGASVIIEKFGTGLPGGNSYQMKNGWAFLDDIVGKLLDKGLLIALVAISGTVLKDLLSLENFDGEQALKAAEAISLMGGVFTAIGESIGIIGKIGVGPTEALRGMEAIATILGVGAAAGVGLGFICQAIAALFDQVWGDGSTAEYLQSLLDTGFDLIGSVVEKFGEVVGRFNGGIFSGAAKAATSGIDVVSENIVKFVEAVQPLGDGEHELNTSAIQSVLRQVEKISKSGFKVGFRNWLIGDDTIGEVTDGMNKIAEAIPNWETKLEGFEKVHLPDGLGALAAEITRVSNAGFGIAVNEFFNSLLGILSPGETKSTIDQFTEAMDAVSTAILSWNSKFAEDGSEKIIFDSKGFSEIVTAMEQVPDGNLSDFIARIFGTESTVEQFSKDMGFLATGLSSFATNLTDGITERKVSVGVRAIATLAEAASNFPSTGDSWMFFREFLGDVRDLAGDALVEFVESISGISDDDITRAMDASHAVRNIGLGLGEILNGDLSTIDTAGSVKNAIEMIVDAISYTAQGDYTMVDKFIESVDKLAGAKLKEASEGIKKEGDLTGAGKSIGTSMVDGISSASFDVSDSVGKVTSDAADAVSDSSGSFASNAAILIDSLAKALNSEENVQKIKDAMIAIAETMSATLRLRYDDFAATGRYLAEGFAVGSSNIHAILAVRAAAAAIGQHAIQALQNAIKSASPSKESARLGGYFWQGFAYEIADGVDQVYTSSHGLGEAAVRGLKTSVRAINAMMDSGLDSEPVIRPVLDLTGIQNGTMALNGMLNVGAPIGLYGNLNAINANVNARNMTTNTDILNALNELGTALNERPVQTNNYNVGGVTYDDGTNVAMAVRDLIHAARIERRV